MLRPTLGTKSLRDMTDNYSVSLAELHLKRLLLGNTGVVVQLWVVQGRLGYLDVFQPGASRWMWLSDDNRELIRPYDGPPVRGFAQPQFYSPNVLQAGKSAQGTGNVEITTANVSVDSTETDCLPAEPRPNGSK